MSIFITYKSIIEIVLLDLNTTILRFLCALNGVEFFSSFIVCLGKDWLFFCLFSVLGPHLIFLLILIAIKMIANDTRGRVVDIEIFVQIGLGLKLNTRMCFRHHIPTTKQLAKFL